MSEEVLFKFLKINHEVIPYKSLLSDSSFHFTPYLILIGDRHYDKTIGVFDCYMKKELIYIAKNEVPLLSLPQPFIPIRSLVYNEQILLL